VIWRSGGGGARARGAGPGSGAGAAPRQQARGARDEAFRRAGGRGAVAAQRLPAVTSDVCARCGAGERDCNNVLLRGRGRRSAKRSSRRVSGDVPQRAPTHAGRPTEGHKQL
jgi:hypothetical protein